MAYTPASSNTKTREYGVEYQALASFELEPAIWGEWYQKYGKGFGIFDFLKMAGRTVAVNRDSVTAFEDGALIKPIRVNASGIATSTTAGDDISFTLHASEYDTDNNTYLRVGDSIIVPALYLSEDIPAVYRVSSVGATSGAACAATPLRATAQITTAVPANAYLKVGHTSFGRGMGQPSARSTYGYSRTFKVGNLKETFELTGGEVAQQSYRQKTKGGGEGLFMRAQIEAEFALDNQLNDALFLSDENDNSVTGTDSHSNSVAIEATKGLWNHMEDLAQELNYVTKFSITDFDTAKDLFRSQGVVDTDIAFLVGPSLITQLDNMGLDFVKEFGSTDLLNNMGELGLSYQAFKKNGLNYFLKELVSFSNPNSFGTDSLGDYLKNAGALIPMSQVKIMDKNNEFGGGYNSKVSIDNVSVGFLNNNGEDFTRVFKISSGVNGMGYPAYHQYDKVEGFYMTKPMLIAMQVNQMIRILKQGTY